MRRRTCWLGKGRWHQQHLRPSFRYQTLVQMREPQIIADGEAQPPSRAVTCHHLQTKALLDRLLHPAGPAATTGLNVQPVG